MNALYQSYDRISDEWSRLNSQWQATASVWNDGLRVWFETQYWQEYEPGVREALNQMEQIGQGIAQAYRELE